MKYFYVIKHIHSSPKGNVSTYILFVSKDLLQKRPRADSSSKENGEGDDDDDDDGNQDDDEDNNGDDDDGEDDNGEDDDDVTSKKNYYSLFIVISLIIKCSCLKYLEIVSKSCNYSLVL